MLPRLENQILKGSYVIIGWLKSVKVKINVHLITVKKRIIIAD